MKTYTIAIDTFIEGDYRKKGEPIRLSEARAQIYLDVGQIIDPDASAEVTAKTSRAKKSEA
ncbi:conserved hypothetical protein [uncultured Pleomorphomonas sp.]|uniref:Uncharacterized protein n=1 Tax=uncultured Pleomorphomonas sp. TaxID=442121 RepID=A0A212LQU6_9HYPH|nr:hypothetical protein [uncultured Pleomorphomonas sp.]SCM79964.1 conserved hypothetical protein [uncultured Pleomorphomonas sp.]